MTLKKLTEAQKQQFDEQGYVFPLDAFDAAQAKVFRDRVEAYEKAVGHDANRTLKIKGHLAFPWLMDIAKSPAILDAVEDLIGPDILLFGGSVFAKDARDPKYVSWHQDSAYFGLSPHREVTAWVAFTEASTDHGCLRVLPGSHRGPAMEHDETHDADNMLAKGQALKSVDESLAMDMPLKPGQFSLHHEQVAHSSLPNRTYDRRIGFAFFFIPTHVKPLSGEGRATLVRGVDNYGYWQPDDLPRFDLDPVSMKQLSESWGAYRDGEVKQAATLDAEG